MNPNISCFGYGSYLFFRKGTLYFRIAVSNYLHSLLKKKEIRKSLGTGRLRESRPLVLRYAVPGSEYFLLAEKVLAAWYGRIRKQYCRLLMLRRKITVLRYILWHCHIFGTVLIIMPERHNRLFIIGIIHS